MMKFDIGSIPHVIPSPEKPAQPEAAPEEKPEDFKLNGALDNSGIPLEHARYADKDCRTCNGSGVMRLVVVDGSVGKVFDDDSRSVRNPKRKLRACACLTKGYTRTRKRFELDFAREKLAVARRDYNGQKPPTDAQIRAQLRVAYRLT